MGSGVTRSELRKVKSIATLLGEESLSHILDSDYRNVRGLHVYTSKNERSHEISISIWDEPKEKKTSHCLFSDKIRESAFAAALEYWHPSYPAPPAFR